MKLIQVIPEWVNLVGLALCIGVVSCRLWVLEPSTGRKDYQRDIIPGMWKLFYFGLAMLTAGSIVGLLMRSSELTGRSFPAFFPLLPTVLFLTHYGRVWLVRIAALILLVFLTAAGKRNRDSATFLIFIFFLVLIVSVTGSATGHASDAGDFSFPEMMDWLHTLAASFWGGGLMVLSSAVLPKLTPSGERMAARIAGAARRFSVIAGAAVGVLVITALYNFWAYVRTASALSQTAYGLAVAAKIILFFVLINLGAFNRYVRVPLLQEWAGRPVGKEGFISRVANLFFTPFKRDLDGHELAVRFKRSVWVEASLVVMVLFCAGLLRHEIPARHAEHMLMRQQGEGHSKTHSSGSMNMDHPQDDHQAR